MAGNISRIGCFERLDQMEVYRLSEFKRILGPLRLSLFHANNYPINIIYNYYMGRLIGEHKKGVHVNIMGLEFQAYELERLQKMGVFSTQVEKDIRTTKVDIYANIKSPIPYNHLNINGSLTKVYLLGKHNFELKSGNIHKKAVDQVSKALNYFKKSSRNHLIIPKDVEVKTIRYVQIYDAGGDILKSDITRVGIDKRIEQIGKRVRAIR